MGADGNLTRLVVAGVLVNYIEDLIQVTWPSRYSGDLAKTGLVIARAVVAKGSLYPSPALK